MRLQELFVRQISDAFRISSGNILIAVIRIKQPVQLIHQYCVNRRERALHFTVHDTLVRRRVLRVTDLVMPSFLTENIRLLIDPGTEYRVQVDRSQVHEILPVSG